MIPIVIAIIASLVIVAPITWFISSNAINKRNDATIGNANEKAREIIDKKINVETSQLLTLIVFTYKFCSSYCQPSFLFIRRMISSTLDADNKP